MKPFFTVFGTVLMHPIRVAFLCLCTFSVNAQQSSYILKEPYTFKTLAGIGNQKNSIDGPVGLATFDNPTGIALGLSGDLIVVDSNSNTIRKISKDGLVTTIAGAPNQRGYVDGPGSVARFWRPYGVAVNKKGEIFVCDSGNAVIRKISIDGHVSTYSGDRSKSGGSDGYLTVATYYEPTGIAIDKDDNFYITDTGWNTIRKISNLGQVSTLAGNGSFAGFVDGTGKESFFNRPIGIALDEVNKNIIVADSENNAIRKISYDGTVSLVAGGLSGTSDGVGSAARFYKPTGVTVDENGDIFVADSVYTLIRKITSGNNVNTIAGLYGGRAPQDGTGSDARFSTPINQIVSDKSGLLYTTERGNVIRCGGYVRATDVVAIPRDRSVLVAFTPPVITAGAKILGYTVKAYPSGTTTNGLSSPIILSRLVNGTKYYATVTAILDSGNSAESTSSDEFYPTNSTSSLSSVAVRTTLDSNQVVIVGFTMSAGPNNILLRAAGPTLATFGVPDVMSDPKIDLYSGQTKLTSNDNWGGESALSEAFQIAGAFAYSSNASLDAALVTSVDGGRTLHVSGSASGTVLVEAYGGGISRTQRFTSLSARNTVGTGANILIAGFTLTGSGTRNLLIRAVGPKLIDFDVLNFLADPKLEIYTGAKKLYENNDWSTSLLPVFNSAGAFALNPKSKDAAITISLPAGGYTVQVSGADGGVGEALIEIYELP
jgi:sugar lactone lactonase YvrE